MLKLARRGPVIPTTVQQALEEDRLVLFCGAGISKYSGLPLFQDLLSSVTERVVEQLDPIEKSLLRQGRIDKVIGLLEGRCVDGIVRRHVVEELIVPSDTPLVVHEALLDLAAEGDGFRIVTTNFDRRFIETNRLRRRQVDVGPRLPVPKPGVWNSVVHLHGLIDSEADSGEGLVLTGSDFGEAYLTDRWASRFVTELFREFTVLFVGYGVDDPVMAYLVDALAAERRKGRHYQPAFAFAQYSNGRFSRDNVEQQWRAKGLEPLLFHSGWHYKALNETLTRWAQLKTGGLTARKQFAIEAAMTTPQSAETDFVNSVVWALSEETGAVAAAFAQADPPPSFDWVRPLWKKSKQASAAGGESLFCQPPAKVRSPEGVWMDRTIRPVDHGGTTTQPFPLSPVATQLCRWLARHLDNPELLEWVLEQGGQLHPEFRRIVRNTLEDSAADTRPGLTKVWEILASEAYAAYRRGSFDDLHDVVLRDKDGRVNEMGVRALLGRLTPVLVLTSASAFRSAFGEAGYDNDGSLPNHFVRCGISFGSPHAMMGVRDSLEQDPDRGEFLAHAAPELSNHLLRCLRWQEVCGYASPDWDEGCMERRSIVPHEQNRYPDEWTYLFDLLLDALGWLIKHDPERADGLVHSWCVIPFPSFERLVLHAAAERSRFARYGFSVLVRRDASALTGIWHRRERLRFFRKGARHLNKTQQKKIFRLVAKGPPRSRFREDTTDDDFQAILDEYRWLALTKLREGGVDLPENATALLNQLEEEHDWQVTPDHKEEFFAWTGEATYGPSFAVFSPNKLAAIAVADLTELLANESEHRNELLDAFSAVGETRASLVLGALRRLASAGGWRIDAWEATFSALRKERSRSQAARVYVLVSRLLLVMPADKRQGLSGSIAEWLSRIEEPSGELDDAFVFLWTEAWNQSEERPAPEMEGAVTRAINHPAGDLAQAAVKLLARMTPTQKTGIPEGIRGVFDVMVKGQDDAHTMARIILVWKLGYLYSIDPQWVEEHLINRMDWKAPAEAANLWSAFFQSPRLYPELFQVLKRNYLATFANIKYLDSDHKRRVLAETLPGVAMKIPDALDQRESRTAIQYLSPTGLEAVAFSCEQMLNAAGEDATTLWREQIGPWIKNVWPNVRSAATEGTSKALAHMILATGAAFSGAVEIVAPLLVPSTSSQLLFKIGEDLKNEPNLATEHPQALLKLIAKTTAESALPYEMYNLGEVLAAIAASWPEAKIQPEYKRLLKQSEQFR
jgi:SIR2-like domain